jgi:hypothetical protein
MNMIAKTENTLLLRTDFANDDAWTVLCSRVTALVGEFQAYVTAHSDAAFDGATLDDVVRAAVAHRTVFVADARALHDPENPVLVVDVESGKVFRVIPAEAWSIENNLSIANMDFDEFAGAADDDGVFRGFTDP